MHFSKTQLLIVVNGFLLISILGLLVFQVFIKQVEPVPNGGQLVVPITPVTRELASVGFDDQVSDFVFHPKSDALIVLGKESSKLYFVDPGTMSVTGDVLLQTSEPSSLLPTNLVINPADEDEAYLSANGRILAVSLETYQVKQEIEVLGIPTKLIFVNNGAELMVINEALGLVHLVDLENFTIKKDINVGTHPVDLLEDLSAGFVYVANEESGSITVISTSNMSVVNTISLDGLPSALAHSVESDELLVTLQNTDELQVLDQRNNTYETPIVVNELPNDVLYYQMYAYVMSDIVQQGVAKVDLSNARIVELYQLGSSFDQEFGLEKLLIAEDGSKLYFLNTEKNEILRLSLTG